MSLKRSDPQGLFGRSVSTDRRREWFANGAVPVAVYGLGKMGLPLAAVYAKSTGNVTGVDIDEHVVEQVNRGESPIANEPGLPFLLSETVESGALQATTDARTAAAQASLHVIIVPTTLSNNQPDLSAFRSVVTDIGTGLASGDFVIVESTVPPGTCAGLVRPALEAESGLAGGEFGVAFAPERTASGRAIRDIRGAYPKIVGGVDEESTRIAALIYEELTENRVIPVGDATVAECVKVFEGVYRDVNIALANELARLTDDLGIDVREAITAANTQPYCDIHEPGAGVGGHCIPYYPYFLMAEVNTETPLLRTARTVNDSMPLFAARKLLEGLTDAGISPTDAIVGVLGVAYRPGVNEVRASPAAPIIDRLTAAGVTVVAVDPVVESFRSPAIHVNSIERFEELEIDGVVLVTAHDEFQEIDWSMFENLVIVDGRDAVTVGEAGHEVYTIGSG